MSDRHAANIAKVQRLRALVENASPLPWWALRSMSGKGPALIYSDMQEAAVTRHVEDPDAVLIVAAVNALPAVLDDVEARLTAHGPKATVVSAGRVGNRSRVGPTRYVCACTSRSGLNAVDFPCADYLAAERVLDALKEA